MRLIDEVVQKCTAAGIPVGIGGVGGISKELISHWYERGMKSLALGFDFESIVTTGKQILANYSEVKNKIR
jgi:phosphoenolpyruvate synthase/pyruvate phosphate dikinase